MVEKGIRANGGDPALDQNALGEAWADLGASFDAGAGSDRTSFTLRTLSDPALLDQAVRLAAREIGEPAFPEDVWKRERERIGASIREANTKPATRRRARLRAGASTAAIPTARRPPRPRWRGSTSPTMRARYAQLIVPCRAKISIVGAVTRAQADAHRHRAAVAAARRRRLRRAAGGARGAAAGGAPGTSGIPFDSAQAHVLIGQPGYRRADPDHFALHARQLRARRRRLRLAPDRAGAREARPGLQRLQQLLAGPACGRLPHRLPDPARPGRRGGARSRATCWRSSSPTARPRPSSRPPRTT